MTEPWYQAGLRFDCTRCGDCCTGTPGFVWVTEEEIKAIAAHRSESVAEVTGLYTRPAGSRVTLRERPNGDCVFLNEARGCSVYAVRPVQCRTWPFWESNTITPEAWQRTCEVCPGTGRGALIPAEEITRRINKIRL